MAKIYLVIWGNKMEIRIEEKWNNINTFHFKFIKFLTKIVAKKTLVLMSVYVCVPHLTT